MPDEVNCRNVSADLGLRAQLRHYHGFVLGALGSRALKLLKLVPALQSFASENECTAHMIGEGVEAEDVLYRVEVASIYTPSLYIARHRGRRELCVVFNGTANHHDLLVDLTCRSKPWVPTCSASGVFVRCDTGTDAGMSSSSDCRSSSITSRSNSVNADCSGGCPPTLVVHEGFARTADTLEPALLPVVEELLCLPEHTDYSLVLVGYSLGAAVASLMTLKWAPRFPGMLRTFAYAPPGVVAAGLIADAGDAGREAVHKVPAATAAAATATTTTATTASGAETGAGTGTTAAASVTSDNTSESISTRNKVSGSTSSAGGSGPSMAPSAAQWLASATADITAVVLDRDLVPRLCQASAEDLRDCLEYLLANAEVMGDIETAFQRYDDLLTAAAATAGSEVGAATGTPEEQGGGDEMEIQLVALHSELCAIHREMQDTHCFRPNKLHPIGRLLFLNQPQGATEREALSTAISQRRREEKCLLEAPAHLFAHIIVSNDMLSNHLSNAYQDALNLI